MTTTTRDSVAEVPLPRVAWTAREVAAQLGLKYETALKLIKDEMEYRRAGRAYLVLCDEFERWQKEGPRPQK